MTEVVSFAMAWTRLAAQARACTACEELTAARRSVVVGDVPAGGARLVLVGEAPGADEDASGRPFVGKAGAVLDAALADAGVRRDQLAVLNVLKCRPPGNRRPTPAEVANCRPWLARQLALLEPALIVSLGMTATTWFLGLRRFTLADVRGRVHEVGSYRVLPTYHPSAALRFGPAGAPAAALRADLATAAVLVK